MRKIFRTLLIIGFVVMFQSMVMLKEEIIAILPKNIEALHIEIVISKLS